MLLPGRVSGHRLRQTICGFGSPAEAEWFKGAGRAAQQEPPNTRLKLPAPVICGKIALVNGLDWRRSLGALR